MIKSFKKFNNPFNLSKDELYNIAEWGLTGEYSFSGVWGEARDLEEAKKIIVEEDFKKFLSLEYPEGFKNVSDPVRLYRYVMLKDIDSLNMDRLGKSWFSVEKEGFFQMLDYLKHFDRNTGKWRYLITADIKLNNIDVKRTLWERSTQNTEMVWVLKDDSKGIDIIDIRKK
jgi:hypothetical protein